LLSTARPASRNCCSATESGSLLILCIEALASHSDCARISEPGKERGSDAVAAANFLDMQPDIGEVREALACVVGDIDRAEGIIDRIREQIKKPPGHNDRFDLNDAINETIALVLGAATKSYVSVVARLTKELHSVQGDRVQLQQVVLNLIVNAVEAMGWVEVGARELSITTQHDERGALVAVYDCRKSWRPGRAVRL